VKTLLSIFTISLLLILSCIISGCSFSVSQKEQVVDVVEPCINLDIGLEDIILPCLNSDDIEECIKTQIKSIIPEYDDLEECVKASIIKIAIDKITEEVNS